MCALYGTPDILSSSKKISTVRSLFPDYLSVSYDFDLKQNNFPREYIYNISF